MRLGSVEAFGDQAGVFMQIVSRVDVMFYRYNEDDSIKAVARSKRVGKIEVWMLAGTPKKPNCYPVHEV